MRADSIFDVNARQLLNPDPPPRIQPVARRIDGEPAEGLEETPCLSQDGYTVAFTSEDAGLGDWNTRRIRNVFATDLRQGQTTLVSADPNGRPANASCTDTSMSADGRWVTFASSATNLVPDTPTAIQRIYLRDIAHGTTRCISQEGTSLSPSISADGSTVAYRQQRPDSQVWDIFVVDCKSGRTSRVPADNLSCAAPSLSADGNRVVFTRETGPPDPSIQRRREVCLYDRGRGQIRSVSITSGGEAADGDCASPALSADGRQVAFVSRAQNLDTATFSPSGARFYELYVHDADTQTTRRVPWLRPGTYQGRPCNHPSFSADGRYLAVESATQPDYRAAIFVHDLHSGDTSRITRGAGGDMLDANAGNVAISGDGQTVAFTSGSSELAGQGVALPRLYVANNTAMSELRRAYQQQKMDELVAVSERRHQPHIVVTDDAVDLGGVRVPRARR